MEGHINALLRFAKTQTDEKSIFIHLKAPILMLNDDRHFFRVAFFQVIWELNPWVICFKSNIKVMGPRQPLKTRYFKSLANDAP